MYRSSRGQWRAGLPAFWAVAALLTCAMANAQGPGEPPAEQPPWKLAGPRSAITSARNLVIRDAGQFARVWKEHQPQGMEAALPRVDFSRQDVVAVFAGSRPTGGFAVEIGRPQVRSGRAEIPVIIWKPGPGMMVTQAFTSPFAFQAVPKLPRIVRFTVTERAREPLP